MSQDQVLCPQCRSPISLPGGMAPGSQIQCMSCGKYFNLGGQPGSLDQTEPLPTTPQYSMENPHQAAKPAGRNLGLIIGISAGGGVALSAIVVLVVVLLVTRKSDDPPANDEAAQLALGFAKAANDEKIEHVKQGLRDMVRLAGEEP